MREPMVADFGQEPSDEAAADKKEETEDTSASV